MSTNIRGNFDGVKENNLIGWVFDPNHHPAEVMAMIDGEFVAFAEANNYRPDLERAGYNNGLCGFRIAIPEQFLEGGTHKVELWLEGGQHRLGPALTFQSPDAAPVPPAATKNATVEPQAIPAGAPTKAGDETAAAKAVPESKPATPAKAAKPVIDAAADQAKVPNKAPAAPKEAKPFAPGKGKAALIPKIDAKSAAFNTIQRSVSESSIFNGAIGTLNKFCNLYADNPYYERLRLAARGTTRLDCFVQISNTLSRVDQAREGQLPKVGPLVSIIMPAHNREDLIDDAIRSVLAQSYKRFELIICDDFSRDNTVAAIKSFKDPRIILTKHAEQKGAAAARNSSLKLARGDIIAYLDSDNVWHPRYLEIMLEELASWPEIGRAHV